MARKRGGLAGIWDRNKGVIKAAVPAALSFIPGAGIPLAAAAGAAMGGFDREGKSGIGFDAFKALPEAVKAGGIAAGTQGARALLTGGGQFGTGSGMLSRAPKIAAPNIGGTTMVSPGVAGQTVSGAARAAQSAGNATQGARGLLTGTNNFLKNNKEVIEMAGKGIQRALPNPQMESEMMNAETKRMQFEEERRIQQQEEERRRRIAELLMPMAQQNFPQYFGR